MPDFAKKFDALAADAFGERSSVNYRYHFRRRYDLVVSWGPKLHAGELVFELGCGDGAQAVQFVEHGLRYRGMDISPEMVRMTRKRLEELPLTAAWEVDVGSLNNFTLNEPVDALVALMRAFFNYAENPLAILAAARPYVRKKLIVDCDPRVVPLQFALSQVRQAGYRRVRWRPYFVPATKALPAPVLDALALLERVPVIRSLPLRYKFHALILAEP